VPPSGLCHKNFWRNFSGARPLFPKARSTGLSAGIPQDRALVLLVRPLGRSSCSLFGAPLLAGRRAPFPRTFTGHCGGGRSLAHRTSAVCFWQPSASYTPLLTQSRDCLLACPQFARAASHPSLAMTQNLGAASACAIHVFIGRVYHSGFLRAFRRYPTSDGFS
jgi:hypothetical protein